MNLQISSDVVSVDWLFQNLDNEKLLIFDATIPKVTAIEEVEKEKFCIPNAIFFDISNQFSDVNSKFPNTVLDPETFEKEAQKLGVHNDSCIVVYDDYGLYSSPRVWWMFQLMGFTDIAVLDGGLPAWKSKNYPLEKPKSHQFKKGNFAVNYQPEKIRYTQDVLENIDNHNFITADARSEGRFNAIEPEPRADVKGGHIPNSVSLPHHLLLEGNKFKSKEELKKVFLQLNPSKKPFIFTCGSGITASVLALAASLAGFENSVYDGSWTEWGSNEKLPIAK